MKPGIYQQTEGNRSELPLPLNVRDLLTGAWLMQAGCDSCEPCGGCKANKHGVGANGRFHVEGSAEPTD